MRLLFTCLTLLCSISSFAQTPHELMTVGKQRYDQADYAGAKSAFDSAIIIKKDDPELYILRGNARLQLKDIKGATEDYTASITLKPSARAYHNLGIIKKNAEDYDGALTDYTKAIETDASYKYAYESRALILAYVKNDSRAALKDLEKLIELDPQNAEAYSLRGTIRGRLGDNKGGIADFTKALELGEKKAEVYYDRGFLEMEDKQPTAACSDFTQAANTGYKIIDKKVLDFMKNCLKGRTYKLE
ncbi:tetratricopeptide repeat protein [Flavitalea sp. BT771]|uniref:tetratricopeptide repeat protein n=1 Tax=Flavitalea sp. BT771 TaxID=3063329 RepID=UPI0026E369C1|nr:tetratricopeptide repeat protein [Flavitalea sp. BT771]MDO6429052.1 tetratricopeptide repeat protein [Flavitalea sp. BT771]MDV6218820.1 tetratricopeptide repeat protein [Flavitalea sp. BT771]